MKIIDTPWSTEAKANCLKEEGVGIVIRYYNNGNSHSLPQKRLELSEAKALSAAGIEIAVTFQLRQNQLEDFSEQKGYEAGQSAVNYASREIGQPSGSTIYFSVDFNPSDAEVNSNIIPYFEGVQKAFTELGGGKAKYCAGAYGSGLVCNTLKANELIKNRWLSMSSGFYGTKEALKSGEYELSQQYPSGVICGSIAVDFDKLKPGTKNIGQFSVGSVFS